MGHLHPEIAVCKLCEVFDGEMLKRFEFRFVDERLYILPGLVPVKAGNFLFQFVFPAKKFMSRYCHILTVPCDVSSDCLFSAYNRAMTFGLLAGLKKPFPPDPRHYPVG